MGNQDTSNPSSDAKNLLMATYSVLAFVPFPVFAAWYAGNSVMFEALFCSVLAAVAVTAYRLRFAYAPYVIATCLVAMPAAFAAAFAGHPWQIDAHMLFFAALAIVSIMSSVKVLLFACALTAVHHASLSLLMPALVFPSVDLLENAMRTGLHGLIVVIEGGVLSLAIASRNKLANGLAEQSDALEAERQEAIAGKTAADQARKDVENVVQVLRQNLNNLSKGDLKKGLEGDLGKDYADLREDYDTAIANLRKAISSAVLASDEFDAGAKELSSSTTNLSERTEQQANALSETATSLRSLANSMSETAQGAQEASASASDAHHSARAGGDVVKRAVAAMGLIEQSSKEISKIIQVIDDISFQTNLLALNAGVEAARAGESGRGFAVVATEVRALAQSTSQAANEVKDLIRTSAEQVADGSRLVGETGHALTDIVEQVDKASGRFEAISDAAQEQSQMLTSINSAIGQIDENTQQNAAMSEEMTAMGLVMTKGAADLRQNMSVFDTGAAKALRTGAKAMDAPKASSIAGKVTNPSERPAKRDVEHAASPAPAARSASEEPLVEKAPQAKPKPAPAAKTPANPKPEKSDRPRKKGNIPPEWEDIALGPDDLAEYQDASGMVGTGQWKSF